MKITVINGTEKRGVTYKLKEAFLEKFRSAEITEYYLPKDCPAFCAERSDKAIQTKCSKKAVSSRLLRIRYFAFGSCRLRLRIRAAGRNDEAKNTSH